MKRIINGLLYDTEKAGLICEWDSDYDFMKDIVYHNVLYRTKAGRYFLYETGRVLGQPTPEFIKPLTEERAFEIMAEYNPDKAAEFFPDKIKEA